jgi:quercetin dioxygenase-like cupin family protein
MPDALLRYTRANWDELPDNPKAPRPPDYEHPWPTDQASDVTSRDFDGPLGFDHLSVVLLRLGPGQSGTHHRHASAEELHFLLEGRCEVMVEGEVFEARKFDAILVPPELTRSLHNHSDEDCWWLVVAAPPDEFRSEGFASYLAANDYPENTRLVAVSDSRFEIVTDEAGTAPKGQS